MPRTRSAPVAESAPHVARLRAREAGTGPVGPRTAQPIPHEKITSATPRPVCDTRRQPHRDGPDLRETQRTIRPGGRGEPGGRIRRVAPLDRAGRNRRLALEFDPRQTHDLRHPHGRIPPLLPRPQRRMVPRGQHRHDGLRHVETLSRRHAPPLRGPLLQGLRHDDRPVRRLRGAFPRTVGARRVLRLVVDVELLQRIQHGG